MLREDATCDGDAGENWSSKVEEDQVVRSIIHQAAIEIYLPPVDGHRSSRQ